MNQEKNNPAEEQKAPAGTPDPATLHTTDPQEHMHGPMSDMMHSIEEEGGKTDRQEPVEQQEQEQHREGGTE